MLSSFESNLAYDLNYLDFTCFWTNLFKVKPNRLVGKSFLSHPVFYTYFHWARARRDVIIHYLKLSDLDICIFLIFEISFPCCTLCICSSFSHFFLDFFLYIFFDLLLIYYLFVVMVFIWENIVCFSSLLSLGLSSPFFLLITSIFLISHYFRFFSCS